LIEFIGFLRRFKPVQTRVLEAAAELSEAKWLALTLLELVYVFECPGLCVSGLIVLGFVTHDRLED